MTIANRVDEAFAKLRMNDLENALIQISIAVDATAKKANPPKMGVGNRCRKFISSNEDFIYYFTLSGMFRVGPQGTVNFGKNIRFGEILYESVRCSLLHEGDISQKVAFTEALTLGHDPSGKFLINKNMLLGLLFAVISDPVNQHEKLKSDIVIDYNGVPLFINQLWGNPDEIKKRVGYVPL